MGCLAPMLATIDNFFRVTERGSTYHSEFWGGMTTFLSMSYIMVLNGIIIAGPFNSGMSVNGVFFATALSAGLFTGMMGFVVNVPVALVSLNQCRTLPDSLYCLCIVSVCTVASLQMDGLFEMSPRVGLWWLV